MNILFIVERNFLSIHIGVRRVIMHYMDEARQKGHQVEVGHWDNDRIIKGRLTTAALLARDRIVHTAHWSSSGKKTQIKTRALPIKQTQVKWTDESWHEQDFDQIVITNPWLCANGLKPLLRAIGIIYDVVPNLLCVNAVRFGTYQDVHGFANQHRIGFEYYRDHCDKVTCISESTRQDFLALFPWNRPADEVMVDIPFKPVTGYQALPRNRHSVLLVNALDWRKNIGGMLRVLTACEHDQADVNVVGRERVPIDAARKFMSTLTDRGYRVNWFRDADESLLQHLYCTNEVLFFPSLYEGLGLPILEAQANGMPAISTNISSCREINMNRHLAIAVDDEATMINHLNQFLANAIGTDVFTEAPLMEAQARYLRSHARGLFTQKSESLCSIS